MVKVGIVGGTGYTGVELLRLLAAHPDARITAITSRGEAGTLVARLFPSLRGSIDIAFSDPASTDLSSCDCVFFATPNGVAMGQARALLAEAVYGLPEISRDRIRSARLVANPGCYATAVQLALLPLVGSDFVDRDYLVADAKSGVSGAGRKAEIDILFSEASDNFRAYAVAGHRHHPEIVQSLAGVAGRPIGLTFVPHLVPMIRGILATVYARITRETDFQELFERRFAGEPFVDVLPAGTHPETRWVRGSNMCRIAVHRPMGGDTLVVLAVEDNLVKGAAGQAVQNMNLMFGLRESCGLEQVAVMP
jgi:N-acetyl-gamma-glutamyl-phosphate reductase